MAFGQLKLNVSLTDVSESYLAKFQSSQLEADISHGGGNCLGNPRDRGAQWATVHGLQRVGQDLVTEQQHIYAMEYQCN